MLAVSLFVPFVVLMLMQWRYRIAPVIAGLLLQQRQAAIAMVMLIGVATAVNLVFSIQERSIKFASARASDPFDLIIAAPGSQIDALLATVFLQPSALPLLEPAVLERVRRHASVSFASPIGFGDQVGSYPLVGTDSAMLNQLVAEQSTYRFTGLHEVYAGHEVSLSIGDKVYPSHGFNQAESVQHGTALTIVGRLPSTGTRWDRAVLAPMELLWQLHGLGGHTAALNDSSNGHSAHPGIPAIVVGADNAGALYQIRQQFNDADSMAFFPAEVLAKLHSVLGSMADVVQILTQLTQLLVVCAVLLSVFILMRSMASRFATLHALGAPVAYRFSFIWAYIAGLAIIGTLVGAILGGIGTYWLAAWLAQFTQFPIGVEMTLRDAIAVMVFLDVTLLLSCVPAWLVSRWQHSDLLIS